MLDRVETLFLEPVDISRELCERISGSKQYRVKGRSMGCCHVWWEESELEIGTGNLEAGRSLKYELAYF